jgi:hypothetical protein
MDAPPLAPDQLLLVRLGGSIATLPQYHIKNTRRGCHASGEKPERLY